MNPRVATDFAHTVSVPVEDLHSPSDPSDTLPTSTLHLSGDDVAPIPPHERAATDAVPPGAETSSPLIEETAPVMVVPESAATNSAAIPTDAPVLTPSTIPEARVLPAPSRLGREAIIGWSIGSLGLLGGLAALALLGSAPPRHPTSPSATRPAIKGASTPEAPWTLAPFLQSTPAPPKNPSAHTPAGATPTPLPMTPQNKQAAQAFARAVQLQKAGKVEAAEQAYREVIKLAPQSAGAAWKNLALLFLQHRQAARAIEPLRKAMQLEPANSALWVQLAGIFVGLKRPQEAVATLHDGVRSQPKDKAIRAAYAQLLQQTGKMSEAYTQWAQLSRLDPENPAPAYWAGALAASLRRLDDAETYLRRAQTIQSRKGQKVADPRVPLLLSKVLMVRRKAPEAVRVSEAGVRQFPRVIELRVQLADARVATHDLTGAIQAARGAITLLPANAPLEGKAGLHAWLGRMLIANHQLRDAIPELRMAVQFAPQDTQTKKLLDAVVAGSKGGATTPTGPNPNLDVAWSKAQALGRGGKWREAAQAYAAYTSAHPDNAQALSEFAFVQEERKNWSEAADLWAKVAVLQPRSPLPPFHRYEALHRLKRNADALTAIRQARALAPRDPDVLLRQADAEALAGNYAEARGCLQTLLEVRPDFKEGYGALAEVAVRGGQVPAAIAFLQAQLKQNPRRREAYDAILLAYDETGQPKTGRKIVLQWIARDKNNKVPRLALDSFDLAKARQELEEGEARDRERARRNAARATPTAAATSAPDVTPTTTAPDAKATAKAPAAPDGDKTP